MIVMMAKVNERAKLMESLDGCIVRKIRASHSITKVEQDFSNA
jgi:hypothetical protein